MSPNSRVLKCDDDLATAKWLLEGKRLLHCGYFCHRIAATLTKEYCRRLLDETEGFLLMTFFEKLRRRLNKRLARTLARKYDVGFFNASSDSGEYE
jgi:hypothetical protein